MFIWFYNFYSNFPFFFVLVTFHHHSSIDIIICTRIGNPVSIDCLGCTATPNLSQNMFFTGTTTIPLTDVMHQNHQSVAMAQNRTPPTLFQYPSKFLIDFCPRSSRFGFDTEQEVNTTKYRSLSAASGWECSRLGWKPKLSCIRQSSMSLGRFHLSQGLCSGFHECILKSC